MKKTKYILLLLMLFILSAFGIGRVITRNGNSVKQNNSNQGSSTNNLNQDSNTQKSLNINNTISDTTASSWKTYTSNNLGFTFQYPGTWTKNGDESNGINLKGEITSTSVNFIDTATQSVFSLTYSMPPYGPEVYKIEEDQYNSYKSSNELDIKKTTVAGNNAIESFTTMSKDIKGNIYDPALKLIHIVFLDKRKTGAFNLNFRTPAPGSEAEIAKFNQVISNFKFIDESKNK